MNGYGKGGGCCWRARMPTTKTRPIGTSERLWRTTTGGAVFRELTHFLQSITELQVPSNLRHFPDVSQENAANGHPSDSLTNKLLARIATADEATRRARLKTIEAGLIKAVL